MSDARSHEERNYDSSIYRNDRGDELMLLEHGWLIQCARRGTAEWPACTRRQLLLVDERGQAPAVCPLCKSGPVKGTWVFYRSALAVSVTDGTLTRAVVATNTDDFDDNEPTREIPKPKKLNGKE